MLLCRNRQHQHWQWQNLLTTFPGGEPRRRQFSGPHRNICLCKEGWRTSPAQKLLLSSGVPVWIWPLSRILGQLWHSNTVRRVESPGPGWQTRRPESLYRIVRFPHRQLWVLPQLSVDLFCRCCHNILELILDYPPWRDPARKLEIKTVVNKILRTHVEDDYK